MDNYIITFDYYYNDTEEYNHIYELYEYNKNKWNSIGGCICYSENKYTKNTLIIKDSINNTLEFNYNYDKYLLLNKLNDVMKKFNNVSFININDIRKFLIYI